MTGAELRRISLTAKAMVDVDGSNMLSAVYIMLAALLVNEAQKADAHMTVADPSANPASTA